MSTIAINPPRNLSHVRAAIYGHPWAITDAGMKQICAIVESHVAGGEIKFKADAADGDGDMKDPGFYIENDVAVVPVHGPIFPKSNLMTMYSGATALSELKDSIQSALSTRPSALILDMDTPGGSVEGLADFADWLEEIEAESDIPIIALANSKCCSAGYFIASQCGMVYATSGAIVGSIGTICAIDNWDRAERNAGNDPIVLRSAELKAVGNGPMSPNQIQEMQRMLIMHDSKFKQAVQRGRPGTDMESISTGQVWHGESANSEPSAQDMGLIDGVSTLEKLIEQYGDPDA